MNESQFIEALQAEGFELSEKQLAQFKLPGLRDAPGESPPPTLLADTIDWITANRAAIEAAQSARQSLLIIVVLAAQC